MKTIVVFFEQPGAWGYPFDKSEYFNSHCQLSAEIEALGGAYVIARGQDTYDGDGRFSRSWRIRDRDVVETGSVAGDVIYDKGDIEAGTFRPVFNCPEVTQLCRDKWESHRLLEEVSPETCLVRDRSELADALGEIDGDMKVVKPVRGYEGHGVVIGPEPELLAHDMVYPVLVQAFLETSNGIPGIVEGIHDFRVTLLNGEVMYAFVRTPPPGGLMAGIAHGGRLDVVATDCIPAVFLDVARFADARMAAHGPRFFTVDMALTPQGVKVIEVNSRVGLQENARHPVFAHLKKALAKVLMSL
ncbi:MAG: hypothetical protein MI824_23665 [Hyphomicrobiales bacterium]|nr:hypothetical protein [Hyphomicrobiales bacterium]